MAYDVLFSRRQSKAVLADFSATAGSLDRHLGLSIPVLVRSEDGRALSRFRYHNAECFFIGIENGRFASKADLLYQIGIVAQLALSSHLLDVGFEDRWCARNIGLDINSALAYANRTGLDYQSAEFERLGVVLSPYGQWRNPDIAGSRRPVPSTLPDIPALLRGLLDHVRVVTGHPRPQHSSHQA